MDRRSWLWRRKSSEKISGETESSGSMSSHSERFSDEQASNNNTHSPEVTSKAAPSDEELHGGMKSLTEKLSAALLNISAKEDLVKQHSRVAEEAVSGWEKAENEVAVLKQKLEAATQRNSSLEHRVEHLDGALKECFKQLRQAREEQEQNIYEAIAEETREWESTKYELESQILNLQSHIEAKNEDLLPKLKLELRSVTEKLELMTIERDFSTQSAETASKQHLESIKKVAKLEAECRRLKSVARKIDHKSVTTSSVHIESSQMVPSVEIDLMDDFLEMERFASLPESGVKLHRIAEDSERALRAEIEVMSYRIAELETQLEKIDSEKVQVQMALFECQDQFKTSEAKVLELQFQLAREYEATEAKREEAESRLGDLEAEIKTLISKVSSKDEELEKERKSSGEFTARCRKLETRLALANEARRAAEGELEATKAKTEDLEAKIRTLILKVSSLDEERESKGKFAARCRNLETELARANEAKRVAEGQLEATKAKTEAAESRLGDLDAEIEALILEVSSLEEELKKERDSSDKFSARCRDMETELARANEAKRVAEGRLEATEAKTEVAESRHGNLDAEIKALILKVSSLEEELKKERDSSDKFSAKCRKLEYEISKMSGEAEVSTPARSNAEMKLKQDKEMAVAASKLAACQKTIASLGKQLKSLATLEDLLIDPENLSSEEIPHTRKDDGELLQKSRYSGLYAPKRDFEAPKVVTDISISFSDNTVEGDSVLSESRSLINSEKSRNAFGKFFPRSKHGN